MFKKIIISICFILGSSIANAKAQPFISGDIGYANTDFEDGVFYNIGGGVQFNDYTEIELAYNNYDGISPPGIDITSLSYGLNLGRSISENIKLFGIIGAERLEADGSISIGQFSIDIDESSTEGFFGIGAAFNGGGNMKFRTKLISHDSSDLITLSVGFAYYFK